MENCIFCKIINKEIPSYKVYEDEDSYAFLDIFPVKKGQTVIIPKKHMHSSFTSVDFDTLGKTGMSAQKVAKILEEKLDAERTFVIIQGLGVDHFHIKLYPYYQGEPEDLSTNPPENPESQEKLEEIYNKLV